MVSLGLLFRQKFHKEIYTYSKNGHGKERDKQDVRQQKVALPITLTDGV